MGELTLAQIGEKLVRGGGAQVRGFEPHVKCVDFGPALLIGFVECGGQLVAFGLRRGQRRIHLLEPRPGIFKRSLAFGEATGQARVVGDGLIKRSIQRLFLNLQKSKFFACQGDLAFQLDHPLVRGGGAVG